MTTCAPIVVFGYNRPNHLRQTLGHLAQADGALQSDLWLFCDGPKPGSDPARIEAVRSVAFDPAWTKRFKSVRVEVSRVNKGLAQSIIGGVTLVMAEAGHAIVVEDDLLVAPDFLRFMNDCLEFYRNDPKVGSITGFSPLAQLPVGYPHDVIAIPRNSSQGWATWADRWQEVDWSAHDAQKIWEDPLLRRRLNAAGSDRANRLLRQLGGQIDSWSIRFGLWQIMTDRITIYPRQNRILNIGYDGTGVHSGLGRPKNEMIGPDDAGMKPMKVDIDPRVLRAFRHIYSGPWYKRAARDLRTWLRTRVIR